MEREKRNGDLAPYDRIAAQWAQGRLEGDFREKKYVEAFIDMLRSGVESRAHVLDLGCGTGQPIMETLLEQGLEVTGLDRSLGMLKLARGYFSSVGINQGPGPEARLATRPRLIGADLGALPLSGRFDGVIAWDCLFHIPRQEQGGILGRLAKLLRPGAPALFSWGGSAGEFRAKMFDESFFYSGFEPEKSAEVVRSAGFEILLQEIDDPSSRGHLAMLCRRGG